MEDILDEGIRKVPFSYFELPTDVSSEEYKNLLTSKIYELACLLKSNSPLSVELLLPLELSSSSVSDFIIALCKKFDVTCNVNARFAPKLLMYRDGKEDDSIILPLKIENLKLLNVESCAASVSWDVPKYNGIKIDGYSVLLSASNDDVSSNTTETKFSFSKLASNTLYEVIIQACCGPYAGCRHPQFKFLTKPTENNYGKLYYWGKHNLLSDSPGTHCIKPTYYTYGKNVICDVAIREDGLYAVGKGGSILEHTISATEACSINVLSLKHVKQISCGHTYTTALTYTGAVYTWGVSNSGALGHGSANTVITNPMQVDLKKEFALQISSSELITIALTHSDTKNQIYVWGMLPEQINKPVVDTYTLTNKWYPTKISDSEIKGNPISVHASVSSYYIITKEQQIIPSGIGHEGRLGLGNKFEECMVLFPFLPIQFPLKEYKILSFSCGNNHCLALLESLDKKPHLYGWGSNKCNKISCAATKIISEPIENVDCPPDAFEVQCGMMHSMILTKSGVYTYGYSGNGVLGTTSDEDGVISKPTLVKLLGNERIIKIKTDKCDSFAIASD
jgi:alpha-tubulin suppressor-like RCC1 family protein